MSLALKYRPFSFRELVGQRAAQLVLYRMVHDIKGMPLEEPTVPHALLFVGNQGSGKTSTGRLLGAALNCTAEGEERPCGKCASCVAVQEGRSVSVLEVDAASNGSVQEIRKLRDIVQYDSGGKFRVVLIDEAHSMSRDAFNALLKVLEEPPDRTIFILLTTEPSKILPTVASRCMEFTFRRISVKDIQDRLTLICEREGITAEPAMLAAIAERADGGLRDAVMCLDQVSRVGITTSAQLSVLLGEADFGPALVKAMVDGDTPALFAKVEQLLTQIGDYSLISAKLVGTLRDLLVLMAGGTISAQGQALADRQALASRLNARRVTAAMQVLWDLRTKVRAGTDPRSSLDLAAVMCLEQLRPKVSSAASNGNGNGGLSVQEMQSLALAGAK